MSLLIKGVQIIDGEGGEPYKSDVLVQRNLISAIGDLKERQTDVVIDGLGNYLTPGFVDVHTNADHYLGLFSDPTGEDFLKQGVTTIIGGHCGASLAPAIYGTIESIRKWADPNDINVDWHSVDEFLEALGKMPLGLNFGTLVGHSTVRRALLGERSRLMSQEAEVMKRILESSMREGAFGISTGLGYMHGRNASKKEIKELADVAGRFGGIYSSHLRDEKDNLVNSVKEVIEVSESTGVTSVISHMLPVRGYDKQFKEALDMIGDSDNVYFDIYPYDLSIRTIYTLLPEWAQEKNIETMLEKISDEETAKLIEKDLKGLDKLNVKVWGAPHHEYLVGKALSQIAENLRLSIPRALIHVMRATGLRAVVSYEDINDELLTDALFHDRALIATHGTGNSSGEFLEHKRSVNSFPKYLETVVGGGKLSIEEAVSRITSKPAKLFDLKKRGEIKEGNIADLVVVGKDDHEVKNVVLGGKVLGEKPLKGEILRHKS